MKYSFKYVNEIEKEDFEKLKTKEYHSCKKLGVDVLENGIVLPFKKQEDTAYGGVLRQDRTYSEYSRDSDITAKDFSKYPIDWDNIPYSEDTVLYLGLYKEQWGHFITSVVSRLWYLVEHLDENIKIVYSTGDYSFSADEIKGNYLKFFELLHISSEQLIEVKEPRRFKKVIVPEISHVPEKYYTDEFKGMYDYIRNSVQLDRPVYKKVYFTRCGNSILDEHDFGEKALKDIFEKNGFQVIEPSGYSVKEQIWIIKNADTIATVSGSLTHNLLFAKDDVELIVLNRQGYPMLTHLYQGAINEMRNANVTHIEASLRLLPVNGAGPNIFYISDELLEFLKDSSYSYIPVRKKGSVFRKYLVLVWYFFRWLDIHNKRNPMRLQRLEGQMDDRSIRIYAFFREKINWYDSEKGEKLKQRFYRIVNKYGRI